MECKGVLLDTSFFIRFLDEGSDLYDNAMNYYRYFIEKEIPMYISTISVAEYCTGGKVEELPFRDLRVIPFNILHSLKSGKFAQIVFREKGKLKLTERNIIPNDTKLFSQADVEAEITHYLSSDKESIKIYDLLKRNLSLRFSFLDLQTPMGEVFGVFDF